MNLIQHFVNGEAYKGNSNKELCFCLSTHTAKSRKDINDLKKILSLMMSSANNLKKVLFKD